MIKWFKDPNSKCMCTCIGDLLDFVVIICNRLHKQKTTDKGLVFVWFLSRLKPTLRA